MTVSYDVQIWAATGSTFAVGSLVADFENVKNIGYATYLNDVGECFFTINQDDPKVNIRAHEGTAHVMVIRNDGTNRDVVWRGILGEHEANETDVIFYAYGYACALYWLQTDWNQTWTAADIGDIISALWTRAKTTLTNSQLGFVTTGTIQNPVTTSGGAVAVSLPSYKAYYKRILFALHELIAVATSDTTNICYFEFAHTASTTDNAVTFNLWKNKSTDRTITWQYGNEVKDFGDVFVPILIRNDVFGVGSGAHNLLFREEIATSGGTYGHTAFGRKMEPIYLTWVRDNADLLRVTKLRSARALRADADLGLSMLPNTIAPTGATGAGWALGDRVNVKIDRGITQIDKLMLVVGQQVIARRGSERVRPLVQDRSGS